ncbi:hypothetical protein [Janthinobacterium fluminis]|uniref:Class IIb bacteriocin, lactobin A/cerein 7B family n=1 Tax=Janthinobacterium fluminis TaxID=2987524 RepID=A0ABT5K505_9BURK|nr:hypothetical protein [Janthinobacterium fluminis]MDC8760087.1 hypothetical protein [Janthinobacterium fluminis]
MQELNVMEINEVSGAGPAAEALKFAARAIAASAIGQYAVGAAKEFKAGWDSVQ